MASPEQDLSDQLDVLSQTPGAIIYRGEDRWLALEPGDIGDVLALDDDLMPYWAKPADLGLL